MKILLQLNQILSSPKIRLKILCLESKSENFDDHKNISFVLKKIKSKHPKNLFFGHWNIKSIRDKFESVKEIIRNTFYTFLFCETKNDSFQNEQFSIPECQIFGKNRNAHGGKLLFYVNQNLNCKALNKYPMC